MKSYQMNKLLILLSVSLLLVCSAFGAVRAAQGGEASQNKAASATSEAKTFQYQHVPVAEVAKTLRTDGSGPLLDTCVLLILLSVSLLLLCSVLGAVGATQGGEASQERAASAKTFQYQHVPVAEVAKTLRTDGSAMLLPSAVISTISPVVVRQDDPAGPKYQEALGYTFLVNSAKYPGLCRMDDRTLVLTLTAALKPPAQAAGSSDDGREELILFSRDEGMTWSQPKRIKGYRTTPMNLGGRNLMLRGWQGTNDDLCPFCFWLSEDGGQTWSEAEPIPALPDGRPMCTDVSMNGLVEGDTVRLIFFTAMPSDIPGKSWQEGGWTAQSFIRSYNFRTHQWAEPVFFPKSPEDGREWCTSEGSLTRAKNGNLVVAFRSRRPGLTDVQSDAWRAISTSVSTDDGKTWSKPALHSPLGYGLVHMSLLPFPDGRILMTYAARVGELDGRVYHGIEAVVSHDDGKTWDWEHRFILFRGTEECMHSPQSVPLLDGRILTVLMHTTSYTWADEQAVGNLLGISHVSAVIWSADRQRAD